MTTTANARPAGTATWGASAGRTLLVGIAICVAVAAILVVVGTTTTNGHAQLHGGSGVFLLLIAAALAWRSRSTGLIAAVPAIGLAAFAIPMLIEGVGALGYDPVTQARTSELANLHDVGLVTTGLGMLVLAASVGAVVAMALERRTAVPRAAATGVGVVIGVIGMLAVKVLTAGF